LKVAQRTFTYRQKLQRAFAGEFLCPFEALEKTLDGDTSDDAIHEAAQHFNVADITVRTLLVNHRVIDRDSLDDFDMQWRSVA
jgi:Zn-dependent peptidase ImmA (M78 family)